MISLIADKPGLVAEQIAKLLAKEYTKGYVKNELSKLARQRAVARRRKIFKIPEIKLGVISRNRWHYFPLWQSDN